MPGLQSYEFALTIDATVLRGTLLLDISVVTEPLFAQHCAEGGKQASSKACVEKALNPDDHGIRAGELGENEWLIGKSGTVVQSLDNHH